MASFLVTFTGHSITVALPLIGKEFDMDAPLLGWVVTLFLIASAIFLIPFGRLAGLYGLKRIYLYGIITLMLGSILSVISPSATWLIGSRVLQGLGCAMIFGTGVAILTSVFPPNEKGKAFGIYSASVNLGASSAPFVGGLLTEHLGWRSIFLLNIVVGVAVLYFTLWKLKGEWIESKGEKFDLAGSAIYALAIILIMYGFTGLPSISSAGFLLAGLLGIIIFSKWETRIANPILDVSIFKNNRAFTFSNLATMINYCALYAVVFLMSLYLQCARGLSPQGAGLILVAEPLVLVIMSPFVGRISDRVQPRIVASVGMAVTCAGMVFLAFFDANTELISAVIGMVILGAGFAIFVSPNVNAVMSSVERKAYSVSSAVMATMRLTGNMLSMGIVVVIFSLLIGRVQITGENLPLFLSSMRLAFGIFAGLCFLGIIVSLAGGKRLDSGLH